jgi:3-methyladenine DNA glycosylase/8-oxoguanine DNA glycosylase
MNPLFLPARPPFRLRAVVDSHGWVELPPFAFDEGTETLTTVTRLPANRDGARVVTVAIREASREAPKGAQVGISTGVTVTAGSPLDKAEARALREQVAWMVGLDRDFTTFYALAREEPHLAKVPAQAKGRILRAPTLFEDVVKTILTTNTSWAGTIRMTTNLVGALGEEARNGARAFPTPERLAALSESEGRALGLGYRAPYVIGMAQQVASGDLDMAALRSGALPTPELRRRLLAIKGVGAYAAASLLMLLGRYDFVPVDAWARQRVSRAWYDGEPVTAAEVEAAFERWGPWRGLAYWFWDWEM